MITYAELAAEVGALVEAKAASYGRSVATSADFLALLYPNGVSPEDYEDALVAARICEKLARRAHGHGAFGESEYVDVVGHALLGLMRDRVRGRAP